MSSSANSIKKNEQKIITWLVHLDICIHLYHFNSFLCFDSKFQSFCCLSVLIRNFNSFVVLINNFYFLCFDSKFQFFCVLWFNISVLLCVVIQNANLTLCRANLTPTSTTRARHKWIDNDTKGSFLASMGFKFCCRFSYIWLIIIEALFDHERWQKRLQYFHQRKMQTSTKAIWHFSKKSSVSATKSFQLKW